MQAALFDRLDLRDITFFGQDWGGLVGCAWWRPRRPVLRVAVGTGLPTGDATPNEAFLRWRQFSASRRRSRSGDHQRRLHRRPLPEVVAAYDAPFPDDTYKAGARIFRRSCRRAWTTRPGRTNWPWEVLRAWTKPWLCTFSDGPGDQGRPAGVHRHRPGAEGQPTSPSGRRPLPSGGPRPRQAGCWSTSSPPPAESRPEPSPPAVLVPPAPPMSGSAPWKREPRKSGVTRAHGLGIRSGGTSLRHAGRAGLDSEMYTSKIQVCVRMPGTPISTTASPSSAADRSSTCWTSCSRDPTASAWPPTSGVVPAS